MKTRIFHQLSWISVLCAVAGMLKDGSGFLYAADNVVGNLITFNNDGAWCWYQDERVVVDRVAGKILIGTNSSSPVRYPTGRPDGSVDLFTFDLASQTTRRFQMADIDEDDHNAPAIFILNDGRYLVMYSNHGNTSMGDYYSRYRISVNPHDSSAWTAERRFDWQTVPGWNTAPNAYNRVSYHNLYYLAADNGGQGRLYNFSRGTHQSANALVFNSATESWSWGGQLTTSSAGGYSTGYLKYASNGVDKIYFLSTETHPRNYNNNIWAGYISDGKSYRLDGTLVDSNLFDNVDTGGYVPDISLFTPVQKAHTSGAGYFRLWTIDLSLDENGYPVALYQSRYYTNGPGPGTDPNPIDHRLHYARWDGTQWHTYEIARLGNRLYSSEEDYTGLGALVPGNPNVIYISTQYDPRDPTGATVTTYREIYKGITTDGGASWTWTPITSNSNVHNLRPVVPAWDSSHTAVIWLRGTYTTAQNTDLAVVGIIEQNQTRTGLIHYVDATTANTTRADGSPIGATGPSTAEGAADGLWHWRSGVGNGGSVLASGGSGSENAPMLKTTLTDLADGVYDIFAFFWANPAQDWRFLAGFDANELMLYRDNGTQQAEAGHFDGTVVLTAGSAALYRAYIGRVNVSGGSAVTVYIDDFGANTTTRTWYDGLGWALVSAVLLGDTNLDGVVDLADYNNVVNNLGAVGGGVLGDTNADGIVDLADYNNVVNNLGATAGVGLAVPEPISVVVWLVGGLGMLRCRR